MNNTPNSFSDPFWLNIAGRTEQKLGLPAGLLASILTKGERSNNDQVSEAGAKTPFQIIPATRRAAIKKYGIDPYLSPENAAEVAGMLLKDSLDRNKNDATLAVAEYHGGVNRENWGPRTKAYVKRVVGTSPAASMGESAAPAAAAAPMTNREALSTFDRVSKQAESSQIPESSIASILSAYQSGQMTPEEAKAFEEDVAAKRIMLPRGAALESVAAAPAGEVLPASVMEAYNNGNMSEAERMDLERDVAAGAVTLPPGAKIGKTERSGFIDNMQEAITGNKRRTAETEALPDWASMPELNDASSAGLKTGLGTMISSAEESAQIIKANFPGVQERRDARGNIFLKSSIDGKEYSIKPGFRPSDIPRAAAGIAAFTPAGRATTLAGSGVATAATQAAIEGTQVAAGGDFSGKDVALAGGFGVAVPAAVRTVMAAKAPVAQAMDRLRGNPPPAPPVPVAPVALPAEELAATARQAALGGIGSKGAAAELAEQAMPNAKTVDAAKRLGIAEHLQPDHVTTNQVYRELAQGIKSFPGSTTRAAELTGLEAVAKRADDLIEEIGGTTDMSLLDKTVKTRMQATQQELEKQAEDLYARVRTEIPVRSTVSADSTLAFLKQHAEDLGGKKRLLPTERNLLATLDGGDGPLTYAFLDQTRKQIGQAMRKASGPFADSESGMLKKLYGSLSDDQLAAAELAGAGDLYKSAQSAVAVRKSLEDDMAALFGKEIDGSLLGGLSSSLKVLPTGDTSKLIALLKAVPEDMRQRVVASGLSSAFRVSAKNGNLSFTNYANWYEGLVKNKQAHAALMSNLPADARKQLSDLYRVSKGISLASKERITTGRLNSLLAGPDTLMASIYDVARRSGAGLAAEAVTTPLGMPGSGLSAGLASALTKGKPNALKAADALISSPEFAELVKRAGLPGQNAAARRLAASKAFKDFVRAIGNERDLSQPEQWILRNLGAANAQYRAPQSNHTIH